MRKLTSRRFRKCGSFWASEFLNGSYRCSKLTDCEILGPLQKIRGVTKKQQSETNDIWAPPLQHIAVLYFSVIWVVKYSTRWEPHIWGWQIVNGAVEAKNGQFGSRFLQNVRVHMDLGKDFFFRSHFSLFQPQNLAVFGGHGQFSGNPVPQVGFAGNPVLLRNGPNF